MKAHKRKFTKTALEFLIELIHIIWDCNEKNIASLLSLNMTKVFNYVSYSCLLYNFKVKGISEYILK